MKLSNNHCLRVVRLLSNSIGAGNVLTRRVLFLLVATEAVWIVTGTLIVPATIVGAYHGTSLPVLNRMITGQAVHPVEKYLSQWSQVVWPVAAIVFIVGMFLLIVVWSVESKYFRLASQSSYCRQFRSYWILALYLVPSFCMGSLLVLNDKARTHVFRWELVDAARSVTSDGAVYVSNLIYSPSSPG